MIYRTKLISFLTLLEHSAAAGGNRLTECGPGDSRSGGITKGLVPAVIILTFKAIYTSWCMVGAGEDMQLSRLHV